MSLKARIEAVIYAAEEPVTLAQLAALFGPEVLERRQSRQTSESTGTPPEAELSECSLVADSEPSVETPPAVAVPQEGEGQPETPTGEANQLDPASAESDIPAEAVMQAAQLQAEDAAAAERRAARQRDREIRDELRLIVQELVAEYASSDRGMEIREVAGGYRVGTKPEYHDAVRAFVKSLKPPIKLSLQALETLAVIAYKQPVTAPEVGEIRGVDSAGVIGSLISRKLVTTAGRKQVIGRPILYKTTKEFLLRFGLKDLNELPSMEEFEKMAGELSDSESGDLPFAQNEIAALEESSNEEELASGDAEPRQAGTYAGDVEDESPADVAEIDVADESHEPDDVPGIELENDTAAPVAVSSQEQGD